MADEPTDAPDLPNLSVESFRPCLDQVFEIQNSEGDPIPLRLIEVEITKGDTHREDRTPFALLFLEPEGEIIVQQQIVRMKNETLGEVDLFLVPLGPDPERGGQRYEVIFS